MWCNQIFSLINNNKIQNTIVCDNYEVANQIAKSTYGEEAIAIDTTLYPVQIGDDYINGIFYRENEVINRNLTEKEQIELLNEQIINLELALVDMYEQTEVTEHA